MLGHRVQQCQYSFYFKQQIFTSDYLVIIRMASQKCWTDSLRLHAALKDCFSGFLYSITVIQGQFFFFFFAPWIKGKKRLSNALRAEEWVKRVIIYFKKDEPPLTLVVSQITWTCSCRFTLVCGEEKTLSVVSLCVLPDQDKLISRRHADFSPNDSSSLRQLICCAFIPNW